MDLETADQRSAEQVSEAGAQWRTEQAASPDCLPKQSYRDLVILVSDNTSDDRTAEIIAEAMRHNPRIRYVQHETNIGALACCWRRPR
jgi:hypothetical protein